jgi:hypothetical protein
MHLNDLALQGDTMDIITHTTPHKVYQFQINLIEPNSELDSLISAFTSPVPSHILTDYDNKSKKRRN